MQTDITDPFLQLGWLQLLLAYWPVFAVAFVTAVVCTPVMRLVATKYGIVDAPDDARKLHAKVTPYLGGAAVFLAVSAGICMSYSYAVDPHFQPFPHVVLPTIIKTSIHIRFQSCVPNLKLPDLTCPVKQEADWDALEAQRIIGDFAAFSVKKMFKEKKIF